VSSLEKELSSQQVARVQVESQLREALERYEAAPKQQVLDRYQEELERLTQEVGGARDNIKE
jgi:predicted  nucleic acid-binding Zn-ribbon protein